MYGLHFPILCTPVYLGLNCTFNISTIFKNWKLLHNLRDEGVRYKCCHAAVQQSVVLIAKISVK